MEEDSSGEILSRNSEGVTTPFLEGNLLNKGVMNLTPGLSWVVGGQLTTSIQGQQHLLNMNSIVICL